MKRALSLLVTFVCLSTPSVAVAQSFGVAPHVGTLGLGADIGISVHPRVTLRAGGGVFPTDIDITASDIEFSIDLPSPQFTAMVDVFLLGNLRLTGGAMLSAPDIEATGVLVGSIDIGGTPYPASEIGNLTGAIVNNDIAPYVGIGWGNIAGSQIGFLLDVGIAFQGQPSVTLSADGSVGQTAAFLADLDQEIADIEEALDLLKYYPVVSLGITIGF